MAALGRDEERRPVWNRRIPDFAMSLGFEVRLCLLGQAQIKGKVENGIKYVRRNLLPSLRYSDLNRQALEWCAAAGTLIRGTTVGCLGIC